MGATSWYPKALGSDEISRLESPIMKNSIPLILTRALTLLLITVVIVSPVWAGGGGGGSTPTVYYVPWKVRAPKDPAPMGLVLYWFPASMEELQKSSLRASRPLSLYATQCISMEVADPPT